ncbi:cytochrome P450 [Oryzibacter oryziterrae]|uniref:cytochrome P450 n=1 Tax=Oryzibacter oryziterrae TaxID=2766474 RepID=UPI001F48FFE6|nr:cytochrome P450 [Oryzibacter oryziterrae]
MTLEAGAAGAAPKPAARKAKPFVPPYPERPEKWLHFIDLIKVARNNFLAIFPKRAYGNAQIDGKLIRRPVMLINVPEMVQEAFVKKHTAFQRKSPQMRHALQPLLGDGLFVSDGKVWEERRKIVGPIIHTNRLGEFLPTMISVIGERREEWFSQPDGQTVDVLSEMARLTAGVICKSVFGSTLSRHHADEIVGGFFDYQRHIDQIDVMSLLGLPDWVPRHRSRLIRNAGNRILAPVNEIIASIAETGRDDSIISSLLKAKDSHGQPLSRDAIRNEAAVIFMAGYETTATTLAWAWYLVSQDADVRARLHKEVDAALGDREPTHQDLAKLEFTRAIIEETLRLYPPVPLLAREALRDETVNGKPVKKGTILLVSPWLLHRNPKLWKQPDAFVPDRFMPTATEKPGKYAYIPFSTGPRVCAGLTFGLTEAILALAMLARHFDLQLGEDAHVQAVCRLTLRPGDTLPMRIHRRAKAA